MNPILECLPPEAAIPADDSARFFMPDPQTATETEPDAAPLRPLNLWRPSQFLAWQEPPGSHFLLPAYLSRRELTTLIGQGGLGKTRLALWLAICQILNKEWCGILTAGEPQKWLFLGDENSIARWKADLERMLSTLTAAEASRVDEFLRLPAPLEMDDCEIWLGDATTQARVALTIEQEAPGIIVADPLGNFAPGDIAKPGEMKEAVRLMQGIVRHTAHEAALLILHHARTGRANIAQGIGYDGANFASGGKPLFAAARCQMNLMPGSSEDDTRLVLSCGKANNCERFAVRGLRFDPQTFTYGVDPEFDAEAWLADVEGRARSGQSLCTVAEVTAAVRDGYTATKDLVAHLTEACATSKSTVERVIRKSVDCEAVKPLIRGKFILGKKANRFLPQ